MLKEITVKNFKALEEVTLSFGRITVLIGPNGTGKSSVLQALALLKQSLGSENVRLSGRYGQFGEFRDLCHGQDEHRHPTIKVKGTFEGRLDLISAEAEYGFVYEVTVDNLGLRAHATRLDLHGVGAVPEALEFRFEQRPRRTERLPQAVPYPERSGQPSVRFERSTYIGRPFRFRLEPLVEDRHLHADWLRLHAALGERFFGKVFFVPVSRSLDLHQYQPPRVATRDFASAEEVAYALADPENWVLSDTISEYVADVTGRRVRFELFEDEVVSGRAADPWVNIYLANEAAGTRALIWLLAQVVFAPPDSVVGVDEPEIHLHPRAQGELTSVLTRLSIEQDKQLVVTTHNDHLLTGFLIQVAEGRLKPEDLAVHYFTKEGRAARAERLAVDDRGGLEGGLKGFFEVDIEQAERRMQALVKKSSG